MRLRWLAPFLVALSSFVIMALPEAAHANGFGRSNFYGYFYNSYDACGTRVFQNGISSTNAGSFETTIVSDLNAGGNYQTGAEFIILTMEGYPAGTPKSTAHNSTVIAQWEADVNYYASKGWINWNLYVSYSVNSYDQAGSNPGCAQYDGSNLQDIATEPNSGSNYAIVFFNPDGTSYQIKRNCGNPLGSFSHLQHQPVGATIQGVKVIPGVGNVPAGGAFTNLNGVSDGGTNPFSYSGVSNGNHTLTESLPAGSNLQYLGYSWCDNGQPTYQGQPSCYYYPFVRGEQDGTATSFTINVQSGHTYDVRLWYKQNVDAAVCVGMTAPTTMTPSTTYQASVTMKNAGNYTWAANQTYNLGSDSPRDNTTWAPLAAIAPSSGGNGSNRAAHVNTTVGPGGQITFTFSFKSPSSLGNYTFAWAMVRDGQYWMDTTPNSICSQGIKVQPPPTMHDFWAASLINTPYQYVRDNFNYFYKLFTYFWPDAGDRRVAGDTTKNLWLSGIWGVISGDTSSSDSSQQAKPNVMTSINTVAEKNCPTGQYGTCLERVPMAYVPQDDGSGNANNPCPATPTAACLDGSQTPHGNNWLAIKDMADGGNTTTNPNDGGFGYTTRLGGIASNQNQNVDGATGTIINNVEISDVHAAAYGIGDDQNGNNCPTTGGSLANCHQGDIAPTTLQPDSGDQTLNMPPGTQGPRAPGSSWTPSNPNCTGSHNCAAWDNLTFNSENSLVNNQGFLPCQGSSVSSLPEFTCDPRNMLGSYASLVQYLTQDNVTSKLQDGQDGPDAGGHHQYPNPTEPMTYTNGALSSSNDTRLVWNEYDNWTQVDDKGHYYTNRGVENIGLNDGSAVTNQTATLEYFSSYNPGYETWTTCTGQYWDGTQWVTYTYQCPSNSEYEVCASPTSIGYYTNTAGYWSGSYQTKYGWLNSNSTITGQAPYGGQGGTAPSYFYQGSYPASGNPSWATNNAANMWQDPNITAMSASGASNPPSFSTNGQWRYDTSDPVYNNRYVFDTYNVPFFYTGYYTYGSDCRWVWTNTGSYSISSYQAPVATYYPSESYLYEYSSCPGTPYQGQCDVTYDGNMDGTVDTGWGWTSNWRRVQYEQTYTGHYRDFGPRSSTGTGDSELYGLSNSSTLTPASLARAFATISNPVVALGTASNDIFGAAGISSYFNSSGCSPGCPSNFLFTNSNLIGFFSGTGYYYNYCVNPDNQKVDAYYPTSQSLSPTVCGNDTAPNNAPIDYVFPNYQAMASSANQTFGGGTTLSGSFDLKGGIYVVNGDLHLNNVQFCTSGNVDNNSNNASNSGGGTFLVSGNLYIDGPVSYCTGAGDTQHLPSVGFVVGAHSQTPSNSSGIIVGSGVQNIVGSYFTNGVFSTCSIVNQAQNCPAVTNGANTTTNDVPFRLDGLVVADWFSLGRQLPAFGGAAATETFNYDGRVIVAPPPGFSSVLKQPATYTEAVPLN